VGLGEARPLRRHGPHGLVGVLALLRLPGRGLRADDSRVHVALGVWTLAPLRIPAPPAPDRDADRRVDRLGRGHLARATRERRCAVRWWSLRAVGEHMRYWIGVTSW